MGGSTPIIESDHELARFAAVEAGHALLALRVDLGFENPKDLRDGGDRLAHDLITSLLADQRPGDAVLSEEGADDLERLGAIAGLDRGSTRRDPGVRRGRTHGLGGACRVDRKR